MTRQMNVNTIMESRRESQQTKLQDMAFDSNIYKRQLKHEQKLSRIMPSLRMFTTAFDLVQNISLGLSFLINIMLLFMYTKDTKGDTEKLSGGSKSAILFFGIVQAILSVIMLVEYILRNIPNLESFENYIDNLSEFEETKFVKSARKRHNEFRYWAIIGLICWCFYVVISIIGIVQWLAYPWLLLYIIPQWSVLWGIVKSLFSSWKQIIQTSIMLLVIIYLYAVYGFEYLNESFISNGVNNCENLLDCFATSFSRGLRSFGGIGDALSENVAPHDYDFYWSRYFYDITSFLVVNALLICLLWGIISDAMTEFQRKTSAIWTEINSVCYVCGINKFEIETKGKGWNKHIMQEHSAMDYMCYLIYIDDKPKEDLNALEMFVKKHKEINAVDYFPIGKARSVADSYRPKEKLESVKEMEGIKEMVVEIKDQVKEIRLRYTMQNENGTK